MPRLIGYGVSRSGMVVTPRWRRGLKLSMGLCVHCASIVRPSALTLASTGQHGRSLTPMEKRQDQHQRVFGAIVEHNRADNSAASLISGFGVRVPGGAPYLTCGFSSL
jgi:hypothetical protein